MPAAPNGLPLANFGDRFLAYLLDALIVGVASLVLTMPLFLLFFLAVMPDMFEVAPDGTVAEPDLVTFFLPLTLLYGAMFAIMLAIYYVYFVEMMIRTGQTIGKRVVKIRVVPLNPAEPLNRAMGARRYLVQFIGGSLVPFGSYVDGLWQLWDKPYQQCLHDKFARTVVVKVPG